MTLFCTVLLALAYQLSQPANAFSSTHASNLEDALLAGYHTMVRPNDSLSIRIEYGMYQINELNNVEQTFSVTGALLVAWADHRLSWDPASYGGMTETYLRDDQIWVPPLVFANSAEDIDIISDDSDTKSIPLFIGSNGNVGWLVARSSLLACTVDITYYPFDEQKCDIKVTTWMHLTSQVRLLKYTQEYVNLDLYEENGEWEVTDTSMELGARVTHGYAMSQATFSVYLARKHSYYIFNIILPVVFISFLGCLVFALPVESGEKNGFSLTILLSLTVVLTMVSDKIPTTSINLCVMSVYLLCTVVLSGLEVWVTVIIQRIHVCTEHGHKLSDGMKRFTGTLAKLTRYTKKDQEDTNDSEMEKRSDVTTQKHPTRKGSKVLPDTPPLTDNYVQLDVDNNDNYEYKDLANSLDRLCFVLFFSITVIVTVTFQLILSVGH